VYKDYTMQSAHHTAKERHSNRFEKESEVLLSKAKGSIVLI
jgi:hypothetical protein